MAFLAHAGIRFDTDRSADYIHRMVKRNGLSRIEAFDFSPGHVIAEKYEVSHQLGKGWEGEVFLLRERETGIERAAKFFFPHRNVKNRTAVRYAKQLHKLRHCPILIQYHTQEAVVFRGQRITMLISEFVEGELLSEFLERQPGKRLTPFQALHLLHALAVGMEPIHQEREYHGDLHAENIIVHRYGLGFELKLLDLFHWSTPKPENIRDDLVDIIRMFYDALGGARFYARQSPEIKWICAGMRRALIFKRWRNVGRLRNALETIQWQ